MSVAVNTPTPFLPITSLQLQHFQAVTRSFAQRRQIISSVFNNFRTLSVATGVVHVSCPRFSWLQSWRLALSFVFMLLQIVLLFRTTCVARRGSFNLTCPSALCRRTSDCAAFFRWEKCEILTWRRPHSMLYFAIQCTETPFGERFGAIPPIPVNYSL